MTAASLTTEWLKDNAPRARPAPRAVGAYRRKPMLYCDLDREAYEALVAHEQSGKRCGKMRRPFPKVEQHGLIGLAFLRANVGFTEKRCLLMPHHRIGHASVVSIGGVSFPAARVMCTMAHGEPKQGHVARHLCGRGHLSCVNPTHLRWGTTEENSSDTVLHHYRPTAAPDLDGQTMDAIRQDDRHYNITAIEHGIPSAVVLAIKHGALT